MTCVSREDLPSGIEEWTASAEKQYVSGCPELPQSSSVGSGDWTSLGRHYFCRTCRALTHLCFGMIHALCGLHLGRSYPSYCRGPAMHCLEAVEEVDCWLMQGLQLTRWLLHLSYRSQRTSPLWAHVYKISTDLTKVTEGCLLFIHCYAAGYC